MKHLDKALDHLRAARDLLDRAIEQLAAYQASTKIDLASQQEASDLVALASRKPS